ncbi:hypothetical protein RISW2_21600 [Roseivivax isoporae LMG 25204]|uniref:Tyr recombinase domain-containing protein n=2 Tax=Roseivivax TaxID=93682 RepID=X7F170_9RHOB|nr:hypothetical protein RISW2_21600 [Roseivivax isoporae LMG 25204]
MRAPGAMDAVARPSGTLGDVIDRYTTDHTGIGKTKAQVLRAIKADGISDMDCAKITSEDIVTFARRLGQTREPQTVGNYLSHLSAVFDVGRPGYGYPLDYQAMRDAVKVCKRLGLIGKSGKRDRRPTIKEMDALMAHFADRSRRRNAIPMHVVSAFAMFSTRRQDEICRITRSDFEPQHARVLVRDMKNPGEKKGNDVWCELPPEALAIINVHGGSDRLFPYAAETVSTAFTRACKFLGIEDLHFHDLRHEGVSRQFEMGKTIPQVASISGHRSWQSLQRYSHLRATGDKWKKWQWLGRLEECTN